MKTSHQGGLSKENRYAVIGEHFYQPSRKASHSRLRKVPTDPQGKDWNRIIAQECYIPQTRMGILEHASFDLYTTIRQEMLGIAPRESRQLKEAMISRGVGDPYLHVLLPDLNRRDKKILITAGFLSFKQETRKNPQWFWPPETALDYETLEVLAEVGYAGVLCAPEQISGIGVIVDNKPIIVKLPKGRQITLLPFDRPLSSSMAFADKSNADAYAWGTVVPRIEQLPKSVPLIGWTDGETFGHHAKMAEYFLQYLLTDSLPNAGITLLSINELPEVWEKKDYIEGKLRERTAWSCPHGNLIRWHGPCPCDGGYHGGWKEKFSSALSSFNVKIDEILNAELGKRWEDTLSRNFDRYFKFKGSRNSKNSLLAAKASSLAAMISCGTFFEDPGTSGNINMLFAMQAIEHLKDAGFEDLAIQLQVELATTLSNGTDPKTNLTLDVLFNKYLQ